MPLVAHRVKSACCQGCCCVQACMHNCYILLQCQRPQQRVSVQSTGGWSGMQPNACCLFLWAHNSNPFVDPSCHRLLAAPLAAAPARVYQINRASAPTDKPNCLLAHSELAGSGHGTGGKDGCICTGRSRFVVCVWFIGTSSVCVCSIARDRRALAGPCCSGF